MHRLFLMLSAACCSVPKELPPTAECVTPCGITAPSSCESLKVFEADADEAFAGIFGKGNTCKRLQGWKIKLIAHDSNCNVGWKHPTGFCVIGYTHISTRTIDLLDTDWREGPLGHEFVHVMDYAQLGHSGHCRWATDELKVALFRLTWREDKTVPEEECASAP